jgi:hypothetical protein
LVFIDEASQERCRDVAQWFSTWVAFTFPTSQARRRGRIPRSILGISSLVRFVVYRVKLSAFS